MANQNEAHEARLPTIEEARGIYTFTATEKIQLTYGVIADSWEQAKEIIEDGVWSDGVFKMDRGDHYGGEYIGMTAPRRAKMIKRTECVGDKMTFTKTKVKFGETEVMYANMDHSDKLIINGSKYEVREYDGTAEIDYGFTWHGVDNGFCACCNGLMQRGWAVVPRREATHTVYGTKLEDEE